MKIIEQSIRNCHMSKKYGYPGIEESKCAGLRTFGGEGESCEECKNCVLQYQHDEDCFKKDEEIMKNFKSYCSDISVCCQSETTEQCLDCLLTYIQEKYILEERELE